MSRARGSVSASFTAEGGSAVACAEERDSQRFGLRSLVGQFPPVGVGESANMRLESGHRTPPVPVRLRLQPQWNLLGSPVASDEQAADIFTSADGTAVKLGPLYGWNGERYGCLAADAPLAPTLGFWVFSPYGGDCRPFSGEPPPATDLRDLLQEGWNLFTPTSPMSRPATPGLLGFWSWDADAQDYEPVQRGEPLIPGVGYWVLKLAR